MLSCCDCSNGYFAYHCDACDEYFFSHYRCNGRICNRCGKPYADKWADKVSRKVFTKIHRHMTFTLPDCMWGMFENRWDLIKVLSDCICETIKKVMKKSLGYNLTPALVAVIHTFGDDLKFYPHVHSLVAEGGFTDTNQWKYFTFFPHEILRKTWQDVVITNISRVIESPNHKSLLGSLYVKYPNGFVVDYGGDNKRIKSKKSVARYIGRYLRHPPISDRRIDNYDGNTVKIWYEKKKIRYYATFDVEQFIRRLVKHIPPKNFKMVRYYGLYNRRDVKENRKHMKQENALTGRVKANIT